MGARGEARRKKGKGGWATSETMLWPFLLEGEAGGTAAGQQRLLGGGGVGWDLHVEKEG